MQFDEVPYSCSYIAYINAQLRQSLTMYTCTLTTTKWGARKIIFLHAQLKQFSLQYHFTNSQQAFETYGVHGYPNWQLFEEPLC